MDAQTLTVNWHHLLLFMVSWGLFYLLGKIFFENVLGQYHSSHLRKWVSVCKTLFLATFCVSCTLLELVCFEILDLLHPTIRQLIWTTSLGLLCVLLNILIPGVFAASISVHLDLPSVVSTIIGVVNVVIFQALMWLLAYFLPLYKASTSSKHLYRTAAVVRSEYSAEGVFYFMSSLLSLDIQTSVALIAVVGTSTAAIIAGKLV